MDKKTIGKRIREERKKQHLTLEKLSAEADMGLVYLGEIERGVKMPSLTALIKIANALDTSTDVILRDGVAAAKPYVLSEVTERMKDLKPSQVKLINDVFEAMIANFNAAENSEDYCES